MILKVISANSSLIWVHTVCRYAKNSFEKFARIFSRRHKQTTFSDAVFLGALRVNTRPLNVSSSQAHQTGFCLGRQTLQLNQCKPFIPCPGIKPGQQDSKSYSLPLHYESRLAPQGSTSLSYTYHYHIYLSLRLQPVSIFIAMFTQTYTNSRTSMARTSLGPWKFVLDTDSSSHW